MLSESPIYSTRLDTPKISRAFLAAIFSAATWINLQSTASADPVLVSTYTRGVGTYKCSGETIRRQNTVKLITAMHCFSLEQIQVLAGAGALQFLSTTHQYVERTPNIAREAPGIDRVDGAIMIDMAIAARLIEITTTNLLNGATISPYSSVNFVVGDKDNNGLTDESEKHITRVYLPEEIQSKYEVLGYQAQDAKDNKQYNSLDKFFLALDHGFSGTVIHEKIKLASGKQILRARYVVVETIDEPRLDYTYTDSRGKLYTLTVHGLNNFKVGVYDLATTKFVAFVRQVKINTANGQVISSNTYRQVTDCKYLGDSECY